MTSDRHLALMTLMRDLEQPTKTFNRSVRLAGALGSNTPGWDDAVEKGNAALDVIERTVRHWAATNRPEPIPGLCGVPSPDGLFVCALEPHDDAELHADRPHADATPNGQRMVWETPTTLPDGFERHTCITVKCAVCGYAYDEAEFTMHFPSVGDALDGPVGAGWDELKDGRVLCTSGEEKHDELRRTVGIASTTD